MKNTRQNDERELNGSTTTTEKKRISNALESNMKVTPITHTKSYNDQSFRYTLFSVAFKKGLLQSRGTQVFSSLYRV